MAAFIPAPALCQGSDEDAIIKMGAIIYPGFVEFTPGANGLRLKLEGAYKDNALQKLAADQFQILIGVLRAWRPSAGQRTDEISPGIGQGTTQDEHGNQVIMVGSVISHNIFGSEVAEYAQEAAIALKRSNFLRDALWLNGQRDRKAADFYMIYEYAEKDLGGSKGIVNSINVSQNDIKRLTSSANNIPATQGGRHANGSGNADWELDDQAKFISLFLKKWISYRAQQA